MLTAMDRARPLMRSLSAGFPRRSTTLAESVVSAGTSLVWRAPLQLMIDVGDHNGLEAWRLLVRS